MVSRRELLSNEITPILESEIALHERENEYYSIDCDDEKILKNLLKRPWNINTQDSMGRTPLMFAVLNNDCRLVNILLRIGADIYTCNNERKNVLQLAFAKNRTFSDPWNNNGVLKLLIDEVSRKFQSRIRIAKELIGAGCRLYQAAFTKNYKIIKYMIKQGASVHSEHPITADTALHVSVKLNDFDSVKVLLKYGAKLSAHDYRQGYTPLSKLLKTLTKFENCEKKLLMLRFLLEHFPSEDTLNFNQISAILENGRAKAISILLQSNIVMNIKDDINKRTHLHYFARNKHSEVIELLKHHIHKFNINARDKAGETPLYVAAKSKNVKMIEFLLEHGAYPNMATYQHRNTPIFGILNYVDPTVNTTFDSCVELLLQYGADPQVIVSHERIGAKLTIFDAALPKNDFIQLNPVIAHLAVIQQLDMPINQVIRSKINSQLHYREYFDKCRRLIDKKIYNHVTLFKLLTEDKNKLAGYSNNGKLMLKLKRISYKRNVRFAYSYYYNTLRKRFEYTAQHKNIVSKAAQGICKIFEDRINEDNIIVRETMDYLTDRDLRQLCEL